MAITLPYKKKESARVRDQLEFQTRLKSDMLQGTYPSNTNNARATLGMPRQWQKEEQEVGGLV